jgi:uncharacterized protein (TIGR03067 family)
MKAFVSGACALIIAVSWASADEKKKFDAEKLVGDWTYVSGEKNGEKANADNLKNKVTFTKDTITLHGEMKFVMKYELDTSKNPVGIKLKMTESPFGAGAEGVGIIWVDGDDLKMCYDPAGKTAPTKFEAKEDSKMHLFVLKRAKKGYVPSAPFRVGRHSP